MTRLFQKISWFELHCYMTAVVYLKYVTMPHSVTAEMHRCVFSSANYITCCIHDNQVCTEVCELLMFHEVRAETTSQEIFISLTEMNSQ